MSVWRVDASVKACWDFLVSPSQHWVDWWPSLRSIDVERTDDVVGSTAACVWRSPLGHALRFTLTLTDLAPGEQIVLVSDGDLSGAGTIEFSQNGNGTRLDIDWQIHTTRRWMNLTGLVLRPLFTWGHNVVMRTGERGLNRVIVCVKPTLWRGFNANDHQKG